MTKDLPDGDLIKLLAVAPQHLLTPTLAEAMIDYYAYALLQNGSSDTRSHFPVRTANEVALLHQLGLLAQRLDSQDLNFESCRNRILNLLLYAIPEPDSTERFQENYQFVSRNENDFNTSNTSLQREQALKALSLFVRRGELNAKRSFAAHCRSGRIEIS